MLRIFSAIFIPRIVSAIVIHSIVCMQFLPLITRTCNVSEGTVDLDDHLVFRYFLPKACLKRSCLRFW